MNTTALSRTYPVRTRKCIQAGNAFAHRSKATAAPDFIWAEAGGTFRTEDGSVATLRNCELVAEGEDLQLQGGVGLEDGNEGGQEGRDEVEHWIEQFGSESNNSNDLKQNGICGGTTWTSPTCSRWRVIEIGLKFRF